MLLGNKKGGIITEKRALGIARLGLCKFMPTDKDARRS